MISDYGLAGRWPAFALVLLVLQGCGETPDAAKSGDPLVVYSARAEHLIKPIFEAYTAKTGVQVLYTTDSEQPLIQKLIAEGETTRADILLTVDAGNLWYAAEQGVLQPVQSATLEQNVPAHLRDPGNRWFGLSVRARTIAYSTERVDPSTLSGYANLAGPEWRGRLCLRTSTKVYNQSLVAMLIAQHGEERTEEIVSGWVANLAADVFSNDTKLLEAIVSGQCDVGIVNSYYFGRLQQAASQLPVALSWPAPETGGVHVNVSGAGVTRHSRRPDDALRLLEWLSSTEAQQLFAGLNLEYPANPGVLTDPLVASWGEFSASPMNVATAGELQAAAVRLMDRAGYH
jgi:iron(III) transport system substrate-binding protein